jgi:RHS repeat-associated protein
MTQSNQQNSIRQYTVLLAIDLKNSVLAEIDAGNPNRIAYSPYGQQSAQREVMTRLGFNGELREARPEWYLLGNGYRAYNPRLMRFHSPDSLSPFGKGGLNAYMYCGGEPVMNKDPTGHNLIAVLIANLKTMKNNFVGAYQAQRAADRNPVTAVISAVNDNLGLAETLGASNLKALSFGDQSNPLRALLPEKKFGLYLEVGGVPSSTPDTGSSSASLPGSSGRGPGGGYNRSYNDESWQDSRAKMDAQKKSTIVTRYTKETKRSLSPDSQKRVKDIRK